MLWLSHPGSLDQDCQDLLCSLKSSLTSVTHPCLRLSSLDSTLIVNIAIDDGHSGSCSSSSLKNDLPRLSVATWMMLASSPSSRWSHYTSLTRRLFFTALAKLAAKGRAEGEQKRLVQCMYDLSCSSNLTLVQTLTVFNLKVMMLLKTQQCAILR